MKTGIILLMYIAVLMPMDKVNAEVITSNAIVTAETVLTVDIPKYVYSKKLNKFRIELLKEYLPTNNYINFEIKE